MNWMVDKEDGVLGISIVGLFGWVDGWIDVVFVMCTASVYHHYQ